jgi:DNA polymerase I-like protein with 3'-5' exonuclease and polymerase domains
MAQIYNELDRYCGAYNLAATSSLRASSSKVFGVYGSNAQNLPPEFRACLVPDPGYALVEVDQASAETRIVANECRYGALQQLFELDMNAHAYACANLFNSQTGADSRWKGLMPKELISSFPAYREWAKSLKKLHKIYYALSKSAGHGYNYMMGWRTYLNNVLANTNGMVVLTAAEAKDQLEGYGRIMPEVTELQVEIELQVRNTGILHNCFGHPRYFVQRMNMDAIRQAVNFNPQSTVGLITHRAARMFAKESKPSWKLLNSVHDSLVAQAPIEEAEECKLFMEQCLRQPLTSTKGKKYMMEVESFIFTGSWSK